MIDYQTWVSRQVGKYEDKSTIKRIDGFTELQIRLRLAHLLVPVKEVEDVAKWLKIFAVEWDRGVGTAYLHKILGKEQTALYYNSRSEAETMEWWQNLCSIIEAGWEPCD